MLGLYQMSYLAKRDSYVWFNTVHVVIIVYAVNHIASFSAEVKTAFFPVLQ